MHSTWFRSNFLRFLKFLQIKEGDLISGGNQFWGNVWIIWSPLLYFTFNSFLDPNSSSFIRFKCVLYDSEEFFSDFSKFYKLKWREQISRENQFCRKFQIFGPIFCVSSLKVLWTQVFRHSLDFKGFSMIQKYFSQGFQMSTN